MISGEDLLNVINQVERNLSRGVGRVKQAWNTDPYQFAIGTQMRRVSEQTDNPYLKYPAGLLSLLYKGPVGDPEDFQQRFKKDPINTLATSGLLMGDVVSSRGGSLSFPKTKLSIKKLTGIDQNAQELSDYLDSDSSSIGNILDDFNDYANINRQTDQQVNNTVNKFIKRGKIALDSYQQTIPDEDWLSSAYERHLHAYPEARQQIYQMRKVAEIFKSNLDELSKAATRVDKILALDKLINSQHSTGGKFMSYAYGIGDIDRGGEFLNNIMNYLRNK